MRLNFSRRGRGLNIKKKNSWISCKIKNIAVSFTSGVFSVGSGKNRKNVKRTRIFIRAYNLWISPEDLQDPWDPAKCRFLEFLLRRTLKSISVISGYYLSCVCRKESIEFTKMFFLETSFRVVKVLWFLQNKYLKTENFIVVVLYLKRFIKCC